MNSLARNPWCIETGKKGTERYNQEKQTRYDHLIQKQSIQRTHTLVIHGA